MTTVDISSNTDQNSENQGDSDDTTADTNQTVRIAGLSNSRDSESECKQDEPSSTTGSVNQSESEPENSGQTDERATSEGNEAVPHGASEPSEHTDSDATSDSGEGDSEDGEDEEDDGPRVSPEIREERREIAKNLTFTRDLLAEVHINNGDVDNPEVVKQYSLAFANTENPDKPTKFLRIFPESAEITAKFSMFKRSTVCDTHGLFTKILQSDDPNEKIEPIHLSGLPQDTQEHIREAIESAEKKLQDGIADGSNITRPEREGSNSIDNKYPDGVTGERGVTTTRDTISQKEAENVTQLENNETGRLREDEGWRGNDSEAGTDPHYPLS